MAYDEVMCVVHIFTINMVFEARMDFRNMAVQWLQLKVNAVKVSDWCDTTIKSFVPLTNSDNKKLFENVREHVLSVD